MQQQLMKNETEFEGELEGVWGRFGGRKEKKYQNHINLKKTEKKQFIFLDLYYTSIKIGIK